MTFLKISSTLENRIIFKIVKEAIHDKYISLRVTILLFHNAVKNFE